MIATRRPQNAAKLTGHCRISAPTRPGTPRAMRMTALEKAPPSSPPAMPQTGTAIHSPGVPSSAAVWPK